MTFMFSLFARPGSETSVASQSDTRSCKSRFQQWGRWANSRSEQAPFIFIIILLVFLKYASGISWTIRNQDPNPPNWIKRVTRPWGNAIMTGASFLHKVKQNLYADMAGWRIITNVKVKQTDVHQGAIGRAATHLHYTLHHSAIKWNELRKHDFVVKTGLFYNKQK